MVGSAYELGVTHWDTAEIYQGKDAEGNTIFNETVVGKGIAAVGDRKSLQIATKYLPASHGDEMTGESCIAACKASCERLGVNYVDLCVRSTNTFQHIRLTNCVQVLCSSNPSESASRRAGSGNEGRQGRWAG